jgi:hypothetical protein
LWDHEQLWEKMGQVFSEYRKVGLSDVVLDTIAKIVPEPEGLLAQWVSLQHGQGKSQRHLEGGCETARSMV